MELKCAVQNYAWGKKGENSEVAKLAKLNSNISIISESCYAELWMGTHPNGPSIISSNQKPLLDWIIKNPQVLGNSTTKFGTDLPFLLKVLSVDKPLSIQAHPTKDHAKELHKNDPINYKDPNHKPEMAIALTRFEALLGFCPELELKQNFENIPELSELVGSQNTAALLSDHNFKDNLKKCFSSLMSSSPDAIENALKKLLIRLGQSDENTRTLQKASLIEHLANQFPGDVGVFGPYFFNYVVLNPGEAIFLAANEPHAYISGDCVECMACSDNVVRAGLTPKFKDVDTLCNMLTYVCGPPEEKKFQPIREDDHTILFSPPVPDFAVAKISVCSGESYNLIQRNSASIAIVIKGEAKTSEVFLKRGAIIFLQAEEAVTITVKDDIVMYQAFCNIN